MNIQHVMHAVVKSDGTMFVMELHSEVYPLRVLIKKQGNDIVFALVNDRINLDNPFGEFIGLTDWVPNGNMLRSNQWLLTTIW